MNITKEFHDYISTINIFPSQYKFKYEKYSPMHKCSRLLRRIKEVEGNLDQLLSLSKKSSSFNNSHLKYQSASLNVKQALIEIESEIKQIKEKDLNSPQNNKLSKKLINNSLDILNQKISDLSHKFQKYLQAQASTIRRIQKRQNDLSKNMSRKNNTFNEYAMNLEDNKNYEDEESLLIEGQRQATKKKHDKYYENRLNEAQSIEKTMTEINGMVNRLSQTIYEHSIIIQHIGTNTDDALNNVEKGTKEVKEILDNVKGNRGLLLRIFFIIIVTSVIYILFFA